MLQAAFVKPAERRMILRALEEHADPGFAAPGPHGAGVGAIAQRKAEGIDEDGLAGAGFSGEHAQTGVELHFDLVDDRIIPDCDQAEHLSII